MMKAFTLIEIIIVLSLYMLILSFVIPSFKKKEDSISTLEAFIFLSAYEAMRENREFLIHGRRNVVYRNDGKEVYVEGVSGGFCMIKPSGRFYMCMFTIWDKKIVFSPLGRYMISN